MKSLSSINLIKIIGLIALTLNSCSSPKGKESTSDQSGQWQEEFDRRLPLLGHRNWILIVDKAYPEQTANGIQTINTNESLLQVLGYVNAGIKKSGHVNAEIFMDKEFSFLSAQDIPDLKNYSDSLRSILGKSNKQQIPHDSVFAKIDSASKYFKVLILKTNSTIAYSSVFIRLNCAYWDEDREKRLRSRMKLNQ